MQPVIYTKEQVLIKPVKPGPCVSIIMPFEPKMSAKSKLEYRLKRAIEVAETELREQYPAYMADLVVKKLKALVASLEYSTYKKSIVLYVSSGIEKVYYLDIVVQEKVIVDKSFQIRDVVMDQQVQQKYLLLLLSNDKAKIILGTGTQFVQLVANDSKNMEAYKNDVAERVSNFSDPQQRKEILNKKFIHHIDDGLCIILRSYPLPLFLACTKKVKGYFMQLSKNKDRVVEFISGNYIETSESQLKGLVQPYLDDWQKTKEKHLLLQMEVAIGKDKCAVGIGNVYKAARQKRGRLLLVEKGYMFPAFVGETNELNPVEEAVFTNSIYIKDAVDDVIEKVLEGGGEVEFVSDGLLRQQLRIALIQFY